MTKRKTPQRPRVDSPSSVSAAVVAAGKIVRPPANVKVDDETTALFAEIVAEIPKVELSAHQIRLAWMLARLMKIQNRDTRLLEEEGCVIPDRHGAPMANPRIKAVQNWMTSVLAMRRTLGLTARALAGGDSRRVAIQRAHNLASEHMLDSVEDETLIAHPDFAEPRKDH